MEAFLGGLDDTKPMEHVLDSFDLEGVAAKILSGSVKNIVVMAGAGVQSNWVREWIEFVNITFVFRNLSFGWYSGLSKPWNRPVRQFGEI